LFARSRGAANRSPPGVSSGAGVLATPAVAEEPEPTPATFRGAVAPHVHGHGGFWFESTAYRSPGLAAVLSLNPMPVDLPEGVADLATRAKEVRPQ